MNAAARLYRRERDEAMLVRTLDGLTLIYHRPSGITHIVATPVPEILAALGPEPCTARTVLERLAEEFDLDGADALDGLIGHLDELCALGLACEVAGAA